MIDPWCALVISSFLLIGLEEDSWLVKVTYILIVWPLLRRQQSGHVDTALVYMRKREL